MLRERRKSWERAIALQPHYNQAIYSLSRLLAKSDPDQSKQLQGQFEKLQSDQHIMDRAQSLGNSRWPRPTHTIGPRQSRN